MKWQIKNLEEEKIKAPRREWKAPRAVADCSGL